MVKRKEILKNNASKDKYTAYMKALKKYAPHKLEKDPKSLSEIYEYYSYVDELYIWLKNVYSDNICVLCNEMRAVMGHLSEFNIHDEEKKGNLGKAYGHLRRLSIDILKIVCNGFDKEFYEWIQKHTYYDYRGTDCDYFPEYVTLYYDAHKAYITAQKAENLGSDRDNNIITKYYKAAELYGKVYTLHTDERRIDIEKVTRRYRLNKIIAIILTFILMIISIIDTIW